MDRVGAAKNAKRFGCKGRTPPVNITCDPWWEWPWSRRVGELNRQGAGNPRVRLFGGRSAELFPPCRGWVCLALHRPRKATPVFSAPNSLASSAPWRFKPRLLPSPDFSPSLSLLAQPQGCGRPWQ